MKHLVLIMFIFVNCVFSKDLIIGIIPYKTKKEIEKIYEPLVKFINQNSEFTAYTKISKDYEDLISLILEKRVDIAVLPSYLYMKNFERLNSTKYIATSLRKKNVIQTWNYSSYIITREDSNINSLKDLEGKSFGFTDKNSASGFLYPSKMLEAQGINYKDFFSKYYFLKKHNRVVQALMNKSVDAVATYDEMALSSQKKYPNKIKILAKSVPIPLDNFVATSSLSKKGYQSIKELLLSYKSNLGAKYISGFKEVDKKVFLDIKELINK